MSRARIVGLSVVVLYIALVAAIGLTSKPEPTLTPEQAKAIADARAKQAEIDKSLEVRQGDLCRIASLCGKYADARQDCAIAGDYQNCIAIRTGDRYFDFSTTCTDDGMYRFAPKDMPNAAQCAVLGYWPRLPKLW